MATAAQRRQFRERIEVLCAAGTDAMTFREAVLRELRRTIGFDAHVWLLTDPVTTVGAAPHARVPAFEHLPSLIKYKYLTPVNRWTELAARGIQVSSLVRATDGDPSRSLVWRKVLAGHSVSDVASAVMVDRAGCWGFLDLWRSGMSTPFDDTELSLLSGVIPMLTRALRTRQAARFTEIPQARSGAGGPVVLLLNNSLEVQSQTPASEEWLRALLPTAPGRSAVPAAAYNAAAQLLAVEQHVDSHEARARVHLAAGTWITARAARISTQIAVSLEVTAPADRLELFIRTHNMTERDGTLLELLADGSDTKGIAQRMFLSELTVQDHLKLIFAKAGVHNRRSLLAQILGTRAG